MHEQRLEILLSSIFYRDTVGGKWKAQIFDSLLVFIPHGSQLGI